MNFWVRWMALTVTVALWVKQDVSLATLLVGLYAVWEIAEAVAGVERAVRGQTRVLRESRLPARARVRAKKKGQQTSAAP